jgi:hypothetical protein
MEAMFRIATTATQAQSENSERFVHRNLIALKGPAPSYIAECLAMSLYRSVHCAAGIGTH